MMISIIVPVYNASHWISCCMQSISKQSFCDFEAIFVDDGSLDNSYEILKKKSMEDSRFKVFHQENQGVSAARNLGLKYAKGSYVTFVDSDDFIDSDYLKSLLYVDENIQLSICGLRYVTKKNKHLQDSLFRTGFELSDGCYALRDSYNSFEYDVFDCPGRKLFRKNLIDDNKLSFPLGKAYGEDVDFVYAYLKYVCRLQVSNYIGYNYVYVNNNSLSSHVGGIRMLETTMHNYDLYSELFRNNDIKDYSYINYYRSIHCLCAVSASYWRRNGLSKLKRIEIYKSLFENGSYKQLSLPRYFAFFSRNNLYNFFDVLRSLRYLCVIIYLKIRRFLQ